MDDETVDEDSPPLILCVDDDPAGRYATCRTLRQSGFEILEASTGAEALLLAAKRPDLILLDVKLPDIDGLEVCRRIKADRRTATIPVVHLSAAKRNSSDRIAGLEGGADGYLTQPAEPKELIATVRAFLRLTAAERALRRSEDRYRDLVEYSQDLILTHDLEGCILSANEATVWLTGYRSGELLQMNILDLLAPDTREFFGDYIHEIKEHHQATGLLKLRTADGQTRYCEYTNSLRTVGVPHPVVRAMARDVTEKLLAQKALRESEARYRSMFDQNPMPMWVCDRETLQFLAVNKAATRKYGFSEPEFLSMTLRDIRPTDEIPRLEGYIDRFSAIAGALPVEEWRHRTKDGEVFEVEISADAVVFGDRPALLALANDVTRRNHHIRVLAESEELCRSTFEQAAVGMAHVGLDGRFLRVNDLLCRNLGYSREELLSKTFLSLTLPADLEADLEAKRMLLAGEMNVYSREKQYIRKDGSLLWIHLTVSAVRSPEGEPKYLISIVEDITRRREAEESLFIQSAALNAAANAIAITDRLGTIEWVNAAFCTLTGYAAEEVIGKNPRDLIKSGQHDAEFYQAMWETIVSGKVWSGELINRRKDGSLFTEEMTITPVRDQAGRIVRFIAVKMDITERKALETRVLRDQRMESIGTLAGGMAHDLNNMLAPILLSIGVLKLGARSDKERKIIDTIESSARRGANLIKQILSFSRGIGGDRVEVQPAAALRDIRDIVGETFPRNIDCTFAAAPDLWTIRGDSTQINQVLMNLCVNARDAMPDGGSLEVRMENAEIDELFCRMHPDAQPAAYLQITVTDTGMGIPRAALERIFDPFFTTKAVDKGTGLGLSTAMAIVKSHGGFILVSSKEGRGTTFSVYFPAVLTADTLAVDRNAPAELSGGAGELILVVDDEDAIRKVVKETLELFNYRVVLASNGAEALKIFEARGEEIAVVLTDMAMPVMDGPTMIQALRALDPNVKIIGSTGMQSDRGLAASVTASLEHFVAKPYTAEALLKALARALGKTS